MDRSNRSVILVVDDDPDDRMLIGDAFQEIPLKSQLHFAEDGEDALALLRRENGYARLAGQPLPRLILLDLNMPRMDGRETLKALKADPVLCKIPVVVLTTSKAEEDVVRAYGLGVNSFVIKPVTFERLIDVVRNIGTYWVDIVTLPADLVA
jgi:two-component system response regulator